jgi:gluconate 2-dehydrogenase gamma chain
MIFRGSMQSSTRRDFCRHVAILGPATALGAIQAIGCKSHPSAPGHDGPEASGPASARPDPTGPPLVTFTAASFATLSAICERLLPRDEDPGAVDLGVPHYIDGILAEPILATAREMVLTAVSKMDRECRKRHANTPFYEASPEQQDEILRVWQKGSDGGVKYFHALLRLTLEGAFGDPKYGGNTDGRGFAMIGFKPDPPFMKMAPMPGMDHGDMGPVDASHG